MSEKRATKSGLSREAQAKIQSKYDAALGAECMQWISSQIGESFNTSGDAKNVFNELRTGQKLAKLVNVLKPGRVTDRQIASATMTFKQMELVQIFLAVAKEFGVPEHECFATVDLTEEQNMNQVIICIQSLMRKFGLGPKEAEENRRQFTEEQLKAGQTVIGLQMGTNKGASQAGMNIGKMRHIVD